MLREIVNIKKRCFFFSNCDNLPILFPFVLEVVHVAARRHVVAVFGLPLFGDSGVDQVARVLHHELALLERLGSDDAAALGPEITDL